MPAPLQRATIGEPATAWDKGGFPGISITSTAPDEPVLAQLMLDRVDGRAHSRIVRRAGITNQWQQQQQQQAGIEPTAAEATHEMAAGRVPRLWQNVGMHLPSQPAQPTDHRGVTAAGGGAAQKAIEAYPAHHAAIRITPGLVAIFPISRGPCPARHAPCS